MGFEIGCLLLNLAIIIGEILINIRAFGDWFRRRCGLLFSDDGDEDEIDDENFYKGNKRKTEHK